MQHRPFDASDLVLRDDGAIYHLGLHPGEIADTVLLVGDPNRVKTIGRFFDTIEVERQKREFTTLTGTYKGKRLTALGTGIGTDNIDIVINELDALVNIDLTQRKIKPQMQALQLIRIGTCGTLQHDIQPGESILSRFALGYDAVAQYYRFDTPPLHQDVFDALIEHTPFELPLPYFTEADAQLLSRLHNVATHSGITATAGGFYGPQGRGLRLPLAYPDLNQLLSAFSHKDLKVLNWEMETSALYALGGALGHACVTICLVVANRQAGTFLTDYQPAMESLIEKVLDELTMEG